MIQRAKRITGLDAISSLYEVDLKRARRCGNTTRIVNNMIELLFQGKVVTVEDVENSSKSKEHLVNVLSRRLWNEHKVELDMDFYRHSDYELIRLKI